MRNTVTIAIPCYNHEAYIKFCLDSIKEDTYELKKVLIIDDGSSDNSVKEIEKWKENNPEISLMLITRNNKGLNSTLNELIERCDTEFFCMLASDDALLPGSIALRIAILNQHSEKMAIVGDANVINEHNEIIYQSAIEDLYNGNKDNYKTDDRLKHSIINEFSIPGAVLLVRTEIYGIIGLYPKIFAEDIFFYLKVIGLNLLIFVDSPVGLYRKHGNNTTGNEKYAKEINETFIYSYVKNIKYYPAIQKMQILKKLCGKIAEYITIRCKGLVKNR